MLITIRYMKRLATYTFLRCYYILESIILVVEEVIKYIIRVYIEKSVIRLRI